MCGASSCDKPNCTWSLANLQQCEARYVARQPAEWRRDFYIEVGKKRGPEALNDLKIRVGTAWKKTQQPSLL